MIKRDLQHTDPRHPESGAVLVLVAISIVALLGVAALAVDLGYLMVTRNEVQNVADGASLAGARQLGAIYQGLPHSEQQTYFCDGTCQGLVQGAAQDVALRNRAGGVDMTVDVEDIRIGRWDVETDIFTPTYTKPNAVHVVARRDEEDNEPVSTFFARVLGIGEVPVNADAIAAMTGQATVQDGELLFPVTLSEWFFQGDASRCNEYIKFSPTDETSCGGWTTWDEKSNAARLKRILDGDEVSPEMKVGETRINTTGGDVAAAFDNMLGLFQRMGCASTDDDILADREFIGDGCVGWEEAIGHDDAIPFLDENGDQTYYLLDNGQPDYSAPRYYHMWQTSVPVYDYSEFNPDKPCANPGSQVQWRVVGFAPVTITDVMPPPDRTIQGIVECEWVGPEDNRGGGGNFGLIGPIPGLVR